MPAILEPPIHHIQQKKNGQQKLLSKLLGSGFFLVALVIHLVALIVLGGWVVATQIIPVKDLRDPDVFIDTGKSGQTSAEPVPADPVATDPSIDPSPMTQPSTEFKAPDIKTIIMADAGPGAFQIPDPGISTGSTIIVATEGNIRTPAKLRPPVPRISTQQIDRERLNKIRDRIGESTHGKGYDIGKTDKNGVTGVQATFTCYVAQYQGGDWDHNVKLSPDGKRITYGAIPNLMTQISRWNKRLKAQVEAVPLNLSDRAALFNSKPPVAFIYFTGHKDFKLTEAEVSNLRDFLMAGGVIWGDAGMPGENSRFDIAFRREMRRILPDDDQAFQAIDDKHEIFRQKGSLAKTVPSGINYFQNPIQVMMVGDQIGVIYTMNSYGNLWQVALDKDEKIVEVYDEGSEKKPNETYTNRALWSRRQTYYRNVNRDSVIQAYRLGMNIVVHLLLQYQDALEKGPRS